MEKLKELKSHIHDENQKLVDLMKSLEIFIGKEIQTLQKTVIHRFEIIEELVRTNIQGDYVRTKDSTSQSQR